MPDQLPQPPPRRVTHFATWDAPGRRTVQAICGAFIRRDERDLAPTCPDCRDLMRRSEELQP